MPGLLEAERLGSVAQAEISGENSKPPEKLPWTGKP